MIVKNKLIGLFVVLLSLAKPTLALSEQQPVNGYYDSKNDWFEFEWINPQNGKQQAFYDSSNKINPEMHARVSFDEKTGIYTYAYRVSNSNGALQVLGEILVQHLSTATNPVAPTDWNAAEYKGKSSIHWIKIAGSPRGIPAGNTVDGFSFQSGGLPTIVVDGFAGKRRVKYTFPSPDDDTEAVQSSYQAVFHSLQTQYPAKFVDVVQRKTVGPLDPPATFNAANFIQSLITLVNQSQTQGWIDNSGITNSLLAKLNTALAKVNANDNATAKNVLGAFMNDVTAQNGKHLTSEAYALLFFNAQYTVKHM